MGRKLISIILIALIFCLGSVTEAQAFVDVRYHWSEPVVEHLAARDLITGYPDGRFVPDRNITRAEMCRLLTVMLDGRDEAKTLSKLTPVFPDVTTGNWARGDINYLFEQGIVTGDEEGLFNPEAQLRRDEAIVMLLRALKVAEAKGIEGLSEFKDVLEVPEYAAGYMTSGIKAGFIKGYPDNTLRPGSSITRAELAVLIERGLNYLSDEYQFWGQLVQYDRLSGKVKIKIGLGETRWVDTVPGIKVFDRDGNTISLETVKVPYTLYFDLDDQGRMIYARAFDTEPTNPIRVEQRKAAEPNQVKPGMILAKNQLQLYEAGDSLLTDGYILNQPETSIEVNKADMKVPELAAATGANGRDVLVAIIDTGIDPGHPDLQITASGQRKLVDFIDYTDEGKINLPNSVNVANGWSNSGVKTDLSRVRSLSGKVRIGYWNEANYDTSSMLSDFNGNGRTGDRVLIVAADREREGVYDTIYVDSNGNGDIRDEIPMHVYRESKQYAVFTTSDGWGFNYVVSSLAADGSYVQLGFDSQGHGTHVAGIIAAHGQMQGIAPDARLLVIKVAGSNGIADPQALIYGMEKAAEMGAQVVNVSMGAPGHPELTDALNRLAKKYGIIFTVAVGNSGPGLNTVTSPGSAEEALRVGAYVSPEQWQVNYGWKVGQPTVCYFSSLGPLQDGALGPLLVAPGSIYSTTPLWQKAKYQLDEGTSMAAPHLAGGVAVLIDALMRQNQFVTPGAIKNALLMSTDTLPNYTLIEQGYGKVNLLGAYQIYTNVSSSAALLPGLADNQSQFSRGLFARDYLPGAIPVTVDNRERSSFNLKLSSSNPAIKTSQEQLLLPGQSSRSFSLDYDIAALPGVYTGFIDGDDGDTEGVELRIPQVIVVPYDLNINQPHLYLDGILPAGMVQHYFLKIPADSGKLDINVRVPQLNKKYMGRVRLHLFDPTGQEVARTGYAGYGVPGESGIPEVNTSIDNPTAGVWEVVVYSTATLSQYQDDASEFSVSFNLDKPGNVSYVPEQKYLVTAVPASIGGSKIITLQIRENQGLKPYNGSVLVQDKLFYVRDGKLQIPRPPENNPYIYLTWQ